LFLFLSDHNINREEAPFNIDKLNRDKHKREYAKKQQSGKLP